MLYININLAMFFKFIFNMYPNNEMTIDNKNIYPIPFLEFLRSAELSDIWEVIEHIIKINIQNLKFNKLSIDKNIPINNTKTSLSTKKFYLYYILYYILLTPLCDLKFLYIHLDRVI